MSQTAYDKRGTTIRNASSPHKFRRRSLQFIRDRRQSLCYHEVSILRKSSSIHETPLIQSNCMCFVLHFNLAQNSMKLTKK